MEEGTMPLDRLREGQRARVTAIALEGSLLQRILDIGLTEGALIRCRFRGPAGTSAAYEIRGTLIALRSADASKITVRLE